MNQMKTLTFLDRPQLATSALKKGLQLADDLIEHLFEEDHSMHKVKVNCTLVKGTEALYSQYGP